MEINGAVIENSSDLNTDNSENLDIQEPSNENIDDNSNENVQEKEPANDKKDESEQQVQSKFKTLEEATKGYGELEKKLGEQSNELGELRKKAELADKLQQQIDEEKLKTAQEKGFDNVPDFENHIEIVKSEADEYAKHLSECEFPDEMIKLLAEYRKNPTKDLLSMIEAEFPTETVKDIAGKMAILKGQLQYKQNEALEEEVKQSAKKYLDVYVEKYKEDFKNPAFASLYAEAFRAYGLDLDSDKFVEMLKQYGESCVKAAGIKNGIKNENSQITDEIAGMSDIANGSAYQKSSILDMDANEMRNAINKYV